MRKTVSKTNTYCINTVQIDRQVAVKNLIINRVDSGTAFYVKKGKWKTYI